MLLVNIFGIFMVTDHYHLKGFRNVHIYVRGDLKGVQNVLTQYESQENTQLHANEQKILKSHIDYWLKLAQHPLIQQNNENIDAIVDCLKSTSNYYQQTAETFKNSEVQVQVSLNRVYTLLNLFGRYIENSNMNITKKVIREFVSMIYCDEEYYYNKQYSYSLTNKVMKCFVSTADNRKGLYLFHSMLKDSNLSNLLKIFVSVIKETNASRTADVPTTETDATTVTTPLSEDAKQMEYTVTLDTNDDKDDNGYDDDDDDQSGDDVIGQNFNIDKLLLLVDNNNQIPIECLMLGS